MLILWPNSSNHLFIAAMVNVDNWFCSLLQFSRHCLKKHIFSYSHTSDRKIRKNLQTIKLRERIKYNVLTDKFQLKVSLNLSIKHDWSLYKLVGEINMEKEYQSKIDSSQK